MKADASGANETLRRRLIRFAAQQGWHVKLKPFSIRRTAPVGPRLGVVEQLLSPELRESVELGYERPQGELFELFQSADHVHKWHHFFRVYEEQFGAFRDRPVRMLEIGVFRGGSLSMWKQWLHADSVIVGLDIDPDCRQYESVADGIHVRIGDQSDAEFLRRVTAEFGPFDLILDDGGHTTTQMIASFNHLFRDALVEGGLYMVEDTHTNFWPGFVDSPMTFIEFCKALVDLIHAPYFRSHSIDPYEFRGNDAGHVLRMSYIEAWLHGVTFHDSIVCLSKRRRVIPVHELR